MLFLDILKSILFGIVEGLTEWLPVSSTAHIEFLSQFLHFSSTGEDFFSLFEVVIQLGAVTAVILVYFWKLFPFRKSDGHVIAEPGIIKLWMKILLACIPAAIVGIAFDDVINSAFYHPVPICIALIAVGFVFIIFENKNRSKCPTTTTLSHLSYKTALIIGLFQVAAAVFPGTSRSGATIIGALLIGVSRPVAVEFTFFLSVPVMLGASLLKIAKYSSAVSAPETAILIFAMLTAFIVSVMVIKLFIGYIKKHDFKIFGYYRIIIGIVFLIVFSLSGAN